MGHIIDDSHSEVVLRSIGGQIVKYGLNHCRGKLLGAQAVAAANNEDIRTVVSSQNSLYILIERLTECAWFLSPVQDGDSLDTFRQYRQEVFAENGR